MSSSDPNPRSRPLAVLALLALGACGFEPVYAPGGPALSLRGSVAVETADTPFDYRLRTTLEDRLGGVATVTYVLAVETEVAEVTAAIATDGSITRYNLPGRADWSLNDAATGAALAAGQVDSFTSYSTTGTTVATGTARQDALDRLAAGLADLIVRQLLIAAPGLP